MTAFCAGCGKEFTPKNRGNNRGYTRYCSQSCHSHTLFYKGGPQASRRRRRYGMEPAEFEQRLKEQNNRCALCLVEFTSDKNIYVDHNHETKENRSLLCPRCNIAIGVFDRLTWNEVLVYFGYARLHKVGVELAKLIGGKGEWFPNEEKEEKP